MGYSISPQRAPIIIATPTAITNHPNLMVDDRASRPLIVMIPTMKATEAAMIASRLIIRLCLIPTNKADPMLAGMLSRKLSTKESLIH